MKLAVALLLLSAVSAQAVELPLRPGIYTSGACDQKGDTIEYAPADRGDPAVITPGSYWIAYDAIVACEADYVKQLGKYIYAGQSSCQSGGKALGIYRFRFTLNAARTTFTDDEGKTYRWCAQHY